MITRAQDLFAPNPKPPMHAATRPDRPPRILIIDDELGPRESLRFLLKTSYEVICTEGVDAGLRALAEREPDLIIMDIRMPRKSGIEGLREIRALNPAIPVIMLTGFGALETAQEALRLGANDYLKKPFDTQEIQEIIARNLERAELERRRLRAAADLCALNARLTEEVARKQHLAEVGQASAEFVHDLRNPLTIVMGYVQLLSDQLCAHQQKLGVEFAETREYLDIIERNVDRCREMARMWQDFSRQSKAPDERAELGALLKDLAADVEPLARSCGAELTLRQPTQPIEAMLRPPEFLRAVHNIVANAVHAVADREGGRIELALERENGQACLVVSDNGKGMTPEQLARAGEPYFTTKGPAQGTGLGLAIARKVMEQHGGGLRIESDLGVGTRVFLQVPAL